MSRLIEQLRRYKDDRGVMANLRCILVGNKRHRAWPVLNRMGVAIDDDVSAYIAGLYATHPEEADTGNLGSSCKKIELKRGDGKEKNDSKLSPTERRFQHLLSAEPGKELKDRVLRMVLLAKAVGIPVNYEQLAKDMRHWNERTKTKWATAYWTQDSSQEKEEA